MKRAIALAVVLTTAAASFGQHEVGVKAGYNHLFTNYDNPLVTNALEFETDGGGYHFGAYYSYTPEDNIFIAGELLISNRRWNEISRSTNDGIISITEENHTYYSNHYLEIPISVKYGVNMRKGRYGDSKYLLFYAGPSAHLLMGTKGSTQNTFRIDAHDQTTVTQQDEIFRNEDLKNYFKPFQMGLHAGISYRFGFGLTIDARYQALLSPTNREETDESNIGVGKGLIKQGMLMFSVGYSFLRD